MSPPSLESQDHPLHTPQLWTGYAPAAPTPELLQPVTNPSSPWHNKPKGGLWTSSLGADPTAPTDWIRWCRAEGYLPHRFLAQTAWLLQPGQVRLLTINSALDLKRIMAAYPGPSIVFGAEPSFPSRFNWELLATLYDGVRVTKRALQACRRLPLDRNFLRSWDAESTVWFHWKFAPPTPYPLQPSGHKPKPFQI